MEEFEIEAEVRTDLGKGATRRLRREGLVPAILYGGEKDPAPLTVRANVLRRQLDNEAFYSHLLTVKSPHGTEQAVLKDLQRHPATSEVTHMDLLRTSATQILHMNVPLHFMNEDTCPGKKAGGVISHLMIDVEVICEARHLPEYIEVDMTGMDIGDSRHLTDLVMPDGVTLAALSHGDESIDVTVVSVQAPRAEEPEEGEEDELLEAGDESEVDEDAGGDDDDDS